ncbi:Por secretion system C-terminal sorting domain-containing protein [Tenacibaculum sp. MAR_2009_124]|uniref:M36 family metallopeptidase n=1 Tax=Tenacibaculum sp. MAR_2009_124 TaxID=1250059 RepID=UPI000898B792|nr:M36 family metallopeptidase [Tenacibaculum sp. MAR_2009_124]SEC88278.1 Por secretion system C-terminal sorting domain-containing protein [Tenacibaculum sp. MAR_2009_124]
MRKYCLFVICIIMWQANFSQSKNPKDLGIIQQHFNTLKTKSKTASQDFSEWKISSSASSLKKGLTHYYLTQYYNGIPIVNGTYNMSVLGSKINFTHDQFVSNISAKLIGAKSTAISEVQAINEVIKAHQLRSANRLVKTMKRSEAGEDVSEYKNSGITEDNEPILVKKVYILHNDKLHLCWNVNLYEKGGKNWWNSYVDASSSRILSEDNWVISCSFGVDEDHSGHTHTKIDSEEFFHADDVPYLKEKSMLAPDSYNVYAMPLMNPDDGGRSIVTNPASANASPYGWHDTNGASGAEYNITRGNNVWAQEDNNGNNGTGASPSGGNGLDFNFPVNLNQAPSNYRDASTTNLFYWNNIMHDVWYQYGFDEASGNFQENNYGNGGTGGDSVNADSQDGSGTNNANFATPGDGSNPRMQMFLWNRTSPGRDGSFDNLIIAHEYGHGISTRLVGGRFSNVLGGSEQMGEGWSDWFGLMLTMKPGDTGADKRGVGTYVLGEPLDGLGIRPTVYSTDRSLNNTDYADIGGLRVPHGVGYAFATILWDMTWALINQEGFDPDFYNGTGGNNIAMALVIEGLKNTANNPGFVAGRDGILQADQDLYGGRYNCLIWKAFAERGVGRDANENNNGGSNSNTDQTVSFVNPCDGGNPDPGNCEGDVSSFPFNESFEASLGLWKDATTGDDLNFTRNTAGTPSNETGPTAAADGSTYIYVEASGDGTGFPNKRAILNSPCLNLSTLTSPKLSFQYHMYGTAINSLTVEARTDNTGTWTSVFSKSGNQGNAWLTAGIDLTAYAGQASVQLRFNVVTGSGTSGWQSDIAIDAVNISNDDGGSGSGCQGGGIASYPFNESFEASLGQWSDATSGDDLNFTRNSGGTPSNSTGPSAAADGTTYVYVEASGNGTGFPNKRAILNSPCLNFTDLTTPTLAFQYHMFGSAINSLTVEARTDNTGTWTSVFSRSGNQGNSWLSANVDLGAYAGQGSVQLRFNVVTGSGTSGWQSDIAIDAVSIGSDGGGSGGDCATLNFNDFTINAFSNQDNSGNYSVSTAGESLTLSNNTWKYISMNYTVTANTVIEFEFSSTSQGEIHGVGFENDNTLTSSRYFKVHGTQNYGITNYDNYAGGTKKYIIPVGSSYTGAMDRLVFINDNDAGSGNNSTFSNVKIYEGSCGGSAFDTNSFATRIDILGNQDEEVFGSLQIAPNPISKGYQLNLVGPNKGFDNATYEVINLLGQVLETGKLTSRTINVDKLKAGVYILSLENEFTKSNKRFIIK